MPRFLSPEWVAAFNLALAGADLAPAGADVSLAASGGRFRVTQVVHGVPGPSDQDDPIVVRTTLVVDAGTVTLLLGEGDEAAHAHAHGHGHGHGHDGDAEARPLGPVPGDPPDPGTGAGGRPAQVTISLSYPDAAELSRGGLDPAEALGSGRVKVRGDLSVLVAGQQVLAAAAAHLGQLAAGTTY